MLILAPALMHRQGISSKHCCCRIPTTAMSKLKHSHVCLGVVGSIPSATFAKKVHRAIASVPCGSEAVANQQIFPMDAWSAQSFLWTKCSSQNTWGTWCWAHPHTRLHTLLALLICDGLEILLQSDGEGDLDIHMTVEFFCLRK